MGRVGCLQCFHAGMLQTSTELTGRQCRHDDLSLPGDSLFSEIDFEAVVVFDAFLDIDDLALLDEPVDLSFSPLLLVSRVDCDVLSLVLDRVVHLATDDSIAGATAASCVYDDVLADFLGSVQDQTVDDCELSVSGSIWKYDRVLGGHLRLFSHQDSHVLSIGKHHSSASFVPFFQTFPYVG